VLSVGLIVAVYGLVRFGYGPQAKHHVSERARASATSAKKKPEGAPSFPLPKGFVGMAVNPPLSESLPAVKNILGQDPQVVETYMGFPGTFPFDQIVALDKAKILPLIQINPKQVNLHFVASGKYDKNIIALADAVKRVHAPVALSFAHEMNGWWYPWSVRVPNAEQYRNRPMFFRAAWRHVWKVFQAQGVTNVTWVWTISRDAQRSGWPDLQSWWPGPRYVDWIGMNGYYRAPGQTFDYLYQAQLGILKTFAPHKPVLITETGVGPGPTQHTQIENLFAGIKRTGLLGFIWFDLNADEHWNIDKNQVAIQAFRDGLKNYGF
jgi:hypothetical protein